MITRLAIVLLVAVHALVVFAGFSAPYAPGEQDRLHPFAPPTRVHVFDAEGKLHFPFVYVSEADAQGEYVQDTSRPFPVQLLPSASGQTRLFGVDAPARLNLLGTDQFGRDVFSRLLHGGRLSLLAGVLATVGALVVGLFLGVLAGFYGRWIDHAVMRAADLFMAIPWLYLLFAVRAALPLRIDTRQTFLMLVIVVGLIGWARPARLIRGIVLSARERAFVTAARGFGALDPYLLRRHVLPQVYGIVLTQAGVLIPQYVAAEVTMSFLGLGVGEPASSWGSMLASLQQYHVLASHWWMAAPVAALVSVMFGYHALTSAVHARLGPTAV